MVVEGSIRPPMERCPCAGTNGTAPFALETKTLITEEADGPSGSD